MRPQIIALAFVAMAAPGTASAQAAADHIAINVTDQQRSIDFYHGAFGLNEIPSPFGGKPGTPRWMRMSNGVELHLQAIKVPFTPPPRMIHFALTVANLDPVIAYLKKSGRPWSDFQGNVGKINRTRTDGVQQIFVQDPDGYWIEVNDAAKKR